MDASQAAATISMACAGEITDCAAGIQDLLREHKKKQAAFISHWFIRKFGAYCLEMAFC